MCSTGEAEDSIPWEGHHVEQGAESDREGAAELKCCGMTAATIPCCSAVLEGGDKGENMCVGGREGRCCFILAFYFSGLLSQ